jgi:TonB family protein
VGRAQLEVDVRNESAADLTIEADRKWEIVTRSGETIPTTFWKKTAKKIPAFGNASVLLRVPEGPEREVATLRLLGTEGEGDARVESPFTDAEPIAAAPASYDPSLVKGGGTRTIRLTARIGKDGRVIELLAPPTDPSPLLEAAKRAFRQWVFEPATENGEPSEALVDREFVFGDAVAFRGLFRMGESELSRRLTEALERGSSVVVPMPAAHGLVALSSRAQARTYASLHVLYLRFSPGPEDGTTWVTVRQRVRARPSGASCPCGWWSSREEGAEGFLAWIEKTVGLTSERDEALTKTGASANPDGGVEPFRGADWKLAPVQGLVDSVLTRKEGASPPAIPAESELAPSPPRRASGSSCGAQPTAPVLKTKVRPAYPEEMRKERSGGEVMLLAEIDEEGNVADLEVISATRGFESAAAAAVCCWKYAPALVDGKPERIGFAVKVEFRFESSSGWR